MELLRQEVSVAQERLASHRRQEDFSFRMAYFGLLRGILNPSRALPQVVLDDLLDRFQTAREGVIFAERRLAEARRRLSEFELVAQLWALRQSLADQSDSDSSDQSDGSLFMSSEESDAAFLEFQRLQEEAERLYLRLQEQEELFASSAPSALSEALLEDLRQQHHAALEAALAAETTSFEALQRWVLEIDDNLAESPLLSPQHAEIEAESEAESEAEAVVPNSVAESSALGDQVVPGSPEHRYLKAVRATSHDTPEETVDDCPWDFDRRMTKPQSAWDEVAKKAAKSYVQFKKFELKFRQTDKLRDKLEANRLKRFCEKNQNDGLKLQQRRNMDEGWYQQRDTKKWADLCVIARLRVIQMKAYVESTKKNLLLAHVNAGRKPTACEKRTIRNLSRELDTAHSTLRTSQKKANRYAKEFMDSVTKQILVENVTPCDADESSTNCDEDISDKQEISNDNDNISQGSDDDDEKNLRSSDESSSAHEEDSSSGKEMNNACIF
ncbi:unnamed protein product [Caenorhabditis auriculariae]|uniref:Uncharacterized protein n=1 Tax=Caenorhabditis auriculariae TaxID=2777116 RepID=A0A8S1H1M0_9PELO|nr:unnamed protein product [Caenorhabditis auriculariae]